MRPDDIDRNRWQRRSVRYAIAVIGLSAIVGSGGGGDDCGFWESDKCIDLSGLDGFKLPWANVDPQRQTVQVGSPATFTVTVGDVDQPSYQWCRSATGGATGCTDIPGASGASYTLAAANLGDDGAVFQVRVYAGNGSSSAIPVAVAVGSLAVSAMPPVVLRDGDFIESDWAVTAVANPSDNGSTYIASRSAAGGNPDAYRAVTFDLLPPQSRVRVLFSSMSATWDPSTQGPILSVDFTEDCLATSPYLAATIPLIEQAGRRFTAAMSVGGARTCGGTGWQAVQRPSLWQEHFVLLDGPACGAGETCPDFSAAGTPIRFGHVSAAELQGGVPGGAMARFSYGIDNWQVRIWRR